MTDLFDRASENETLFREQAIAAARRTKKEVPDQDEHGCRYCLSCGVQIAQARLHRAPDAVRCVPCQSMIETRGHRHGR